MALYQCKVLSCDFHDCDEHAVELPNSDLEDTHPFAAWYHFRPATQLHAIGMTLCPAHAVMVISFVMAVPDGDGADA